jgi:hypothetical protein
MEKRLIDGLCARPPLPVESVVSVVDEAFNFGFGNLNDCATFTFH